MTREQRDAWAAALRSGKYPQGLSTLYPVEDGIQKFCCLGVLAHAVLELPIESDALRLNVGDAVQKQYVTIGTVLAGTNHSACDFWELNDAKQLSFARIAQLVDLLPVKE